MSLIVLIIHKHHIDDAAARAIEAYIHALLNIPYGFLKDFLTLNCIKSKKSDTIK